MKQKFTLNIAFLFISVCVFSQADLVVTNNYTIQTTNVSVGNYLSLTFRVRNNGNVASGKSHTLIYISPTNTITSNTLELSNISTEALAANTETQDINYIYPLPYNCTVGTNYLIIKVDSQDEVVETNEANAYYLPNTVTVNSTIGRQQNLPYPVVFVHGLNSDNTTWDNLLINFQERYGWSYGGNMNFCLNQSSTSTEKNQNYKDWTDSTTLGAGDFFTINFNVDRNGNTPTFLSFSNVLSNQASIVKQGLAIKAAIRRVLQLTGRDKVILVGHSMGGLASREYLQNSYLWQPDGNHHVAKLLTVGTPHGGSNSSDFGLTGLVTGLDVRSEAVRDLRTSYYYSNQPGVYLFGGTEDYPTMKDILIGSFYNVDVNCNGVDADGTTIVGLNNKSIPTDLAYSCVVGTSLSSSDGVVTTFSANLNNFKAISADTFNVSAIHTSLPKQAEAIIKGMDEANDYDVSYNIKTNQLYFGNFSIQSKASVYINDYDDYKFSVLQNGNLTIKVYDINLPKCYIRILDSAKSVIYSDNSNGKGYWELNVPLTAGKYYCEIYGTPRQMHMFG